MRKSSDRLGWRALLAMPGVVGLRYLTAPAFFALVGRLVPWFGRVAALLCVLGLGLGLLSVLKQPAQASSGGILLLLMLPVMWMSVFLYAMMLLWIGLGWLLDVRISAAMLSALAPTGAVFAFLAFWTGLLWGKSATGSWLAWDLQLVPELVLLFLYLIYLGLQIAIEDRRWAERASALLVVAGAFSVPVLCAQVLQLEFTAPVAAMLRSLGQMNAMAHAGMLLTVLGLWAYSVTAVLLRVRCILLEQERHAHWAGAYVKGRL